MSTITRTRIKSIDLLRGLVMVIMALDHVRDYFSYDAYFFDPTDLTQTSVALFLTRFVTHFCAPVFVFLAGTSAFFVGMRRGKKALSIWLLKRGIWLIIVEITIIKLAWFFKLDYSILVLQVIWALGCGMLLLAGLIHFDKKWVIAISLVFICCHNLFDTYSPSGKVIAAIWTFLHEFNIIEAGNIQIFIAYPLIPWVFVMPLGYYFGELYLPEVDQKYRVKKLRQLGIGLILLFFIIRIVNIYGDPYVWSQQNTFVYTLLSFFNVTKYPPSLLYLLITLGPSILFLSFTERWQGAVSNKLITIGRVPMFFYIVHIYLIHIVAVIAAMATGFSFSDMVIDVWVTLQPNLQGYGFDLWVVYLIWILLIPALYPICRWYDQYKSQNRQKWWLSYL